MKGTMSAATVHKQYNEVVSAFRRLIADPALRARFDGEADGYFRRCALGVWQADNASSITPPSCGVLQRHLYQRLLRPLRPVLGGGHRGGRL